MSVKRTMQTVIMFSACLLLVASILGSSNLKKLRPFLPAANDYEIDIGYGPLDEPATASATQSPAEAVKQNLPFSPVAQRAQDNGIGRRVNAPLMARDSAGRLTSPLAEEWIIRPSVDGSNTRITIFLSESISRNQQEFNESDLIKQKVAAIDDIADLLAWQSDSAFQYARPTVEVSFEKNPSQGFNQERLEFYFLPDQDLGIDSLDAAQRFQAEVMPYIPTTGDFREYTEPNREHWIFSSASDADFQQVLENYKNDMPFADVVRNCSSCNVTDPPISSGPTTGTSTNTSGGFVGSSQTDRERENMVTFVKSLVCVPSHPVEWKLHTIVDGDTPEKLAKPPVTADQLLSANCLIDKLSEPGTRIHVPPQ